MEIMDIELSAAFIDNAATPYGQTKLELAIENASGTIEIENKGGSPRSVHDFVLLDPSCFGYGSTHNLSIDQVAALLALSCSLANPRILFSLRQYTFLSRTIRSPKAGITEGVLTVLGTKVRLDEGILSNIAGRLLLYRIFDPENRPLLESNVLAAIDSYREALLVGEGRSCHSLLYSAFEKAVNADANRTGQEFDKIASVTTSLTEAEVEELRNFNSRIKHVHRNKTDLETLKTAESNLGRLSWNLKKAADRAILARIY